MDLILWRHAEALEMREVQDDLDRALTPKGEALLPVLDAISAWAAAWRV